jgi:hypothetical protein
MDLLKQHWLGGATDCLARAESRSSGGLLSRAVTPNRNRLPPKDPSTGLTLDPKC